MAAAVESIINTPRNLIGPGLFGHLVILHTADYAEFCHRAAGRFIHHLPTESGDESDGGAAIHTTLTAIRAAGMPVDENLWPRVTDCNSKCHQCHGGCYDSPKRA